ASRRRECNLEFSSIFTISSVSTRPSQTPKLFSRGRLTSLPPPIYTWRADRPSSELATNVFADASPDVTPRSEISSKFTKSPPLTDLLEAAGSCPHGLTALAPTSYLGLQSRELAVLKYDVPIDALLST